VTVRPRPLVSPLRLFVALATLIVAFVTGTGVAGARSGVAAITPESGPAVGAVGDVTPGRVGFEGLLFDDGVLGCCVAPEVSALAPAYPIGAAAQSCAGIGARTTAALIDGQGFASALGEGFDRSDIFRDAAGGLIGGMTFRAMGGYNPAISGGRRAVIGGASFAAEGAVINGATTFAEGGSAGAVFSSTGQGATRGFALGALFSVVDKPSAPRRNIDAPRQIPHGFGSSSDFASFGDDLYAGLRGAGYDDATAIFQGSSVTGQSYRTGAAFDVGRVSDFDVALASPQLLSRADALQIGLRSGGSRTGPLTAAQLERLGLGDLATSLSSSAGRPVNFMIFDSVPGATSRAPSIVVPG
jgi:hypothetical protein